MNPKYYKWKFGFYKAEDNLFYMWDDSRGWELLWSNFTNPAIVDEFEEITKEELMLELL